MSQNSIEKSQSVDMVSVIDHEKGMSAIIEVHCGKYHRLFDSLDRNPVSLPELQASYPRTCRGLVDHCQHGLDR